MPYLNTDDGFPDHEKIDVLSDGAFRLHVAGMHYCARKLTDGTIPHRHAREHAGAPCQVCQDLIAHTERTTR